MNFDLKFYKRVLTSTCSCNRSFIFMAALPVEDEPPKKRKRSYDAAFKLNVVEYAEKNSNRGAGRRLVEDFP